MRKETCKKSPAKMNLQQTHHVAHDKDDVRLLQKETCEKRPAKRDM